MLHRKNEVRWLRNIAVTLIDRVVSEIGSAESVRGPILAGWPATAKQLAVAGAMWNPRLMRVSKRREALFGLSKLTWRVIFTANLPILPIFGEKRPSGTPQEQNVIFPKAAYCRLFYNCCAEP